MTRREVILILGGAAAWPMPAGAQQRQQVPVVGYLFRGSSEPTANIVPAFRQGLNETGYVEGRNLAIEYRFAEGHADRLPALAADLVRRRVAVIAAPGGTATVLAAKALTTAIPIVFGRLTMRTAAWATRSLTLGYPSCSDNLAHLRAR